MTSPQYLGPIFQHGYVVPDAEKAARKWAERMGVGPFYIIDQKIDDYVYRGQPMPVELRIAMGYWGDIQIELIQPLSGDGTFYHDALKTAPGELNHQAVLVPDIDKAIAELGLNRFIIHTGSLPMIRFAYLENYLPDGLTFELIQADEPARMSFGGAAAICRGWNGECPVRTHADLASDLAQLRDSSRL
jgi:methylmalonyl-CoA/ethylmalonyl-CoA epimerase